jgi:dephospho-CoA kinase
MTMLMIGLTGGMGSGKSTVAKALARRGARIIDADAIARQVVEPGTPALAKLVERFGPGILAPDGTLNRPALGSIAFVDDETRKELEAITHPAIAEEFFRQIAEAPPDAILVHDVPLLVESTRGMQYDAVIVVEAPLDVRLDRLEARGVARDDAAQRIALQASDDERREVAAWVVNNAGNHAALEAQLDFIWEELQKRLVESANAANAD